ncbi:hybrid sensor histidine kinase/response regulator [Methylocella tundrae]|uniref:histidine kinase n=1 Tax=Methylocella tundrae TaxID=227605 RepID=A0A4U8Z583_METTU|nr:PAS domain-containing sensor histidine kinase [Methylocella tundrae]WPP04335.1 PAS domain S-box protein [Methylocella tundrae]VFU10674.1 Histidine kinase [Methylocella tundrae]
MDNLERFDASAMDDGRYRLLVNAVTDYAIFMLDPEGVVTSWNPGAQRFKGYEASEILGENFSRFYVEEDRRAGLPRRALDTAAREGKFETEGWRVRKDGARFWAHVVIDPIRGPSGELLGFTKITRDLTERKFAEETLKRSEEQFRILVQSVTDYSIFMLDSEGHVSSWNLGAERIKGYLREEVIGEHFSKFYTPEDLEKGEPQRAIETAAREGRFEKEGWRVRKDGTRFWANVVIDAIRDENGAVIGFAKITRDITERREAQRAIEEAREALFQSQKMDAIGQLTGGVAHDFNNLLMAILGSLELVRKRLPDEPKFTSLIDNAMQAAQRGASLTQRMLAFARRQELKPEPVDLPTLVRGMTDLLQRSLGPAMSIETRFPLALPSVQADTNQLELSLLNLAVNARDAMPEGGVIIIAARAETVSGASQNGLAGGAYVCLSVTDTGEGMDEATLSRAMEPFFTTKGIGKGTGLGLPMVHGLAEQSGGRLALKSQKGKGTTAELWLPVAQRAAAPASDDEQPPTLENSREVSRLVVVAVDDDPLVLTNTAAMLADLGHTVFEASGGRQALSILRRESVDLVITDQAMPRMTGTQLADAIRAEWPALPVVLATGYAELSSADTVHLPRLSKPFRQDDLMRAIADALAANRRRVDR